MGARRTPELGEIKRTVDDLVTALEEGRYCGVAFRSGPGPGPGPGRVAHEVQGVLWGREYGRAKRVTVIAEMIVWLGLAGAGGYGARRRPVRRLVTDDESLCGELQTHLALAEFGFQVGVVTQCWLA